MKQAAGLGAFEKNLTWWVLLSMALGTILGPIFPAFFGRLAGLEWGRVNIPIAILIWLMIFPMMLQIDFSKLGEVRKNPKGLWLTLVVNWLVKPFSMAFFAWLFFEHLYAAYIETEKLGEYVAGAILLGAAPCTAMVFVWSYLSRGDANYTLVQVAVNDLVLLVAFVPIVGLLLGVADVHIPYDTLLASVLLFVVVPLAAGWFTHRWAVGKMGTAWLSERLIPAFKPITIFALLATLVLLFAFQGKHLIQNPLLIVLIAVPLTLQTYFIFFASWFAGRYLNLSHAICAPASLIGASNFFELAVAVAIALFGLESPAALVTVVGVLVEVPLMLSLVAFANRQRY
jgi:ACR3 family arsenite transporter